MKKKIDAQLLDFCKQIPEYVLFGQTWFDHFAEPYTEKLDIGDCPDTVIVHPTVFDSIKIDGLRKVDETVPFVKVYKYQNKDGLEKTVYLTARIDPYYYLNGNENTIYKGYEYGGITFMLPADAMLFCASNSQRDIYRLARTIGAVMRALDNPYRIISRLAMVDNFPEMAKRVAKGVVLYHKLEAQHYIAEATTTKNSLFGVK